jgi:aspartate aminotransferase
MNISERLKRLKPSATLTISAKAAELKAQGREIINLSVGEPDFGTPAHVVEAAKKALDEGFTRYTPVPGIPALREAVAGYFERFYGVKAKAENTIVSNGGKQVLYNLFAALLNPSDEVLIPSPYWVSYPDMVSLFDAAPVAVPTRAEAGFLASVADLDAARTPRTRMLILNSPSNPTGAHYSQEAMLEIAEWAKARGVFIVADEVYDRLVFAPAKPATLSKWWEENQDHVAVAGALSKAMCMTGLRVGYALAHPDLVKAMSKIQGQSTSNVCSVAQKAALAAFTGPWDSMEAMNTAFARRRDLALSIIKTWPGVVCPRPDGAFYLFPVVGGLYTKDFPDSVALCARLLEDAGVAAVPGAAFGDDRCIRLSYALADEVLEAALKKIGKVLVK